MNKGSALVSVQLQKLEQNHQRLIVVHRIFIVLVCLIGLGLGTDLVHALVGGTPPISSVRPDLKRFRAEPASIPLLDWTTSLFHSTSSESAPAAAAISWSAMGAFLA